MPFLHSSREPARIRFPRSAMRRFSRRESLRARQASKSLMRVTRYLRARKSTTSRLPSGTAHDRADEACRPLRERWDFPIRSLRRRHHCASRRSTDQTHEVRRDLRDHQQSSLQESRSPHSPLFALAAKVQHPMRASASTLRTTHSPMRSAVVK